MDVSPGALEVAARNAQLQHTPVNFIRQDVLAPDAAALLPCLNVIVSNPPYIPEHEIANMQANVSAFEPSMALFVPDNDPLRFYRRIGQLANERLEPGGKLYFEIHEDYSDAVITELRQQHFTDVTGKKDMFGKDRMVRATKA